jgi:hypothetical protein
VGKRESSVDRGQQLLFQSFAGGRPGLGLSCTEQFVPAHRALAQRQGISTVGAP